MEKFQGFFSSFPIKFAFGRFVGCSFCCNLKAVAFVTECGLIKMLVGLFFHVAVHW